MKKILTSIFLFSTLWWLLIATIPIKLLESEDPVVHQRMLDKFMELTQQKLSTCIEFEITAMENEENEKLVDVIVQCHKFEI